MSLNICLVTTKLIAGFLFNSQVIIADGLHGASDLITDVAVLAGLRVSKKPADTCHHYGHRRIATLVGMFVGASLLAATAVIMIQAIRSFHDLTHNRTLDIQANLPFWLALATVPLKEILFRLTRRVGMRAKDASLIANAWHDRSDAMASIAAAVGLAAVMLGGRDWQFMDPLAATVVGAMLLPMAVNIIRDNAGELIDRAPEAQVLEQLERAIRRTGGVKDIYAFRARRIGGKIAMDVNVLVDPSLTVAQGHDIASEVRNAVQLESPDVIEVMVHIEPAES